MISVVILSYNTLAITLDCLIFLFKSKGMELEVIVIDNASTDGSAEAIAKKFPQVKLVKNSSNLGFAKANNQGMQMAKGDIFLLLNSDVFVLPDTLATCQKYLDKFAVVGCKLLNADGSIQFSWGYFPTLFRIYLLMSFIDNFPIIKSLVHSIHVRDISQYTQSREVDWVTGAFMMLKNEVFAKTGGIDEKYFMYGEEMEWMYRVNQAGLKVGYIADASATHLGGASTKSQSKMFSSEMKGYFYWFNKHNPHWQIPILKFILVSGLIYKAKTWTILGWILGKSSLGRDYWQAFRDIRDEVFDRPAK